MNSLVEENYLKALFHLSENGKGEVNVKDLSKHLEIKMPTVNSMMKKLAEKELVIYESYKPLRLSDKGILKASLIVRKHRLTEMFLVDKMGFGWEQVHEIAEQIEHIQSPIFFDKMDELLNFPKLDPHGSPIPDKNGKIEIINYKKLAEFKEGDKVEICAVIGSSDEFLKYLNSKNIHLNDEIEIISVEDFDGTMKVKFLKSNEIETFSNHVTSRLLGR
ncbi:metal-dependent transcriptional regulator [Empedobacter falsenii]|uniref:Transcriptional regulator MntR n=1 Tax=Empedobacter falsenii TaxID=343874 RepID=A0A376GEF9_9FLAO|nr:MULTISPECIES: metal-dependent transcriptional regulator [Empedobacter]MBW1619615.1 metal-dependent transcriptional regulator [Empedobacter falsenii]MBY0068059.1 metal-dependent transcriptional regulator [Empedobacter falsenii]MDH0659453.1 metal-dependent transcriptional regulator [Empedobacter sp. GD03865]MDH0675050.1 metal-dependent transcriptional regulator [Empedobacter sp. GD03861]STD58734.1 Iron-dependent repressor IdeR [Empedobacter falsenii]